MVAKRLWNKRQEDGRTAVRCPHSQPPFQCCRLMTAVTLDQAERIIDAILARGAALNDRPLSVIVVAPGCKVKAFKKER